MTIASPEEPEDPSELAAKHAPWARRIALSLVLIYSVFHLRDDLVGTALLTLTRVAESFDRTRGRRFEVFAYKRIAGEVLDEIGKELRRLAFLRAPMLDASM
jgi:DNA-directed RNA polymerase specialized sigma subunit